MMKHWLMLVLAIALLLVLTACGGGGTSDTGSEDPPTNSDGSTEVEDENVDEGEENPPNGEEAEDNTDDGSSEELVMVTVELLNTDGDATGTAEVTDEENGVNVALNLENLESGAHGIQFHDAGQCEVPDFGSAGEAFGGGDAQTVEAGDDGTVTENLLFEDLTLGTDEENSLLKEGGTSLVVYAQEQDEDRVACGVVTAQQP